MLKAIVVVQMDGTFVETGGIGAMQHFIDSRATNLKYREAKNYKRCNIQRNCGD